MQPTSRFVFLVQTCLLVLAVSGWAAFAGAWLRLTDAESALDERQAQSDQIMKAADEVVTAKNNQVRVLASSLRDVEARLAFRENQLRQYGIPLEPPRTKP